MLSNYMRLELLITMYTESLLDLTPFWVFALAALIKLKIILTTFYKSWIILPEPVTADWCTFLTLYA